MSIAVEHPVQPADPGSLLSPEVTERLARRITIDHPGIDEPLAQRIVAQTAAFLAASGHAPGQSLAPSKLVDVGWHSFILHTVDYADFCRRVAGRFIHHVPTDEPTAIPGGPAEARDRTLTAITAAGYTVDTELWPELADCSQCHAGCHDSPNSGGNGKK
jgi:hypothetical protein